MFFVAKGQTLSGQAQFEVRLCDLSLFQWDTLNSIAQNAIVPNGCRVEENEPDFRIISRCNGFDLGAGRISQRTGAEYVSVSLPSWWPSTATSPAPPATTTPRWSSSGTRPAELNTVPATSGAFFLVVLTLSRRIKTRTTVPCPGRWTFKICLKTRARNWYAESVQCCCRRQCFWVFCRYGTESLSLSATSPT